MIKWAEFRTSVAEACELVLDFSNALSHHCTVAWVTRPERSKGVKDVIKQARRAQSRPEGPQPRSRRAFRLLVPRNICHGEEICHVATFQIVIHDRCGEILNFSTSVY